MKKVTAKQLQPGAVLLLQSGRMDLITEIDPQSSIATLMLAGAQTMSALGSSIFVGSIRYDHGEVQLGPQVEYSEPRKVTQYSEEELARIVSLPPAPVQEPEEKPEED